MNNVESPFEQLRRDFSQKCIAETMPLEFIKFKADKGLLNTDMDMQRHYVWTSSQEQELIDSILLNVRIPEFHAIVEEDKWNICDGKQRFTCLFKFLNNEIPFLKSSAREELQFLFHDKNKFIYFSQLPEKLQADILNTTITIAKYSNLTRKEQISLFRKINNGTALSSLAKGLASYYYMRTDYTYFILSLPQFQTKIMKSKNQEELESAIIRTLILYSENKPIDLQPKYFEKYYPKFENINYIVDCRENIINGINKFSSLDFFINNCQAWVTGLPFLLYSISKHKELNKNQANKVMNEFITVYKPGRGSDLGVTAVAKKIDLVEKIVSTLSFDNSSNS